jgi:hypothetical protein
MDADFRQLFCEATGCRPADFERRMFSRCLFRHAVAFKWLIRNKEEFFREDLEMLRDIGSARNTPEVISELNRFYGRNRRDKSILRTQFFVRISGKRVLRVYRDLAAAHALDAPLSAPAPRAAG